jgi:hypothetical protein
MTDRWVQRNSHICKAWANEQEWFKTNPNQYIVGLNTYRNRPVFFHTSESESKEPFG